MSEIITKFLEIISAAKGKGKCTFVIVVLFTKKDEISLLKCF